MIDKSREYSYTGIPTFMKSDYGDMAQLADYQVGVFGVPVDTGVSNRAGARHGPSAIRRASTWYNPQTQYSKGAVVDLYQRQKVVEIDLPRILDLGDVTIYPTDYAKTLQSIEELSYQVSRSAFPIILGGDHSITYAVIKGLAKGLEEKSGIERIGILHFDSHPDVWDAFITLEDVWHGSPFRRLIDEGIIKGDHLVMIGDREVVSVDEYDYIRQNKIRLSSISDIWAEGMVPTIEAAVDHLAEATDGIYVSLDIDVFDPCFAPGTGTPVPGGLTPRDMIQAIDIICKKAALVGIDVVEVAPDYDPAGSTQNLAAFVLNRFLMYYQGF